MTGFSKMQIFFLNKFSVLHLFSDEKMVNDSVTALLFHYFFLQLFVPFYEVDWCN